MCVPGRLTRISFNLHKTIIHLLSKESRNEMFRESGTLVDLGLAELRLS